MKSAFYLRKILVPVDGSHPCLQAEELVAAIAKNFKSEVMVIHVVSPELACMKDENEESLCVRKD